MGLVIWGLGGFVVETVTPPFDIAVDDFIVLVILFHDIKYSCGEDTGFAFRCLLVNLIGKLRFVE